MHNAAGDGDAATEKVQVAEAVVDGHIDLGLVQLRDGAGAVGATTAVDGNHRLTRRWRRVVGRAGEWRRVTHQLGTRHVGRDRREVGGDEAAHVGQAGPVGGRRLARDVAGGVTRGIRRRYREGVAAAELQHARHEQDQDREGDRELDERLSALPFARVSRPA